MKDLKQLKEQYEKLGNEIKKLEQQEITISLPYLPTELTVLFSDKSMNWEDAKLWCKEQGGRLPTKFELQYLAASGNIPEDKRNFYYWSSTESDYVGNAWYVDLYNGYAFTDYKRATIPILCVR